jgi:hypothetical protein
LIKAVERILISAITLPLRADVRHSVSLLLHSLRVKGRKSGASNAARLAPNSLASDFSVSVFSFSVFQNGFRLCARAIWSPARFWPDCCGLRPPVIKQIVFWILFVGLGCLFLLQKLNERKQHAAKAALATAASHSSPTPSASPVSPAAGQPAKPKPTAILPPPPALKLKPTPMLPKPTPMLPKPTPMLHPNPNGVQ